MPPIERTPISVYEIAWDDSGDERVMYLLKTRKVLGFVKPEGRLFRAIGGEGRDLGLFTEAAFAKREVERYVCCDV